MSQLANRWSGMHNRVHLITLSDISTDQYPVQPEVVRHGLNLMGNSRGLLAGLQANWQRVRSLRRLLADLSPDLILSFCDRMNITTISAATPLHKPLWIAEHSDPSRQHLGLMWETWRQLTYRRLKREAQSGCVVLTKAIATTLQNRFPGLKTLVIPPAIQLNQCTNTSIQEPLSVQPPSGSLQLLAMGRHSPEKNLVGLLNAWAKLRDKFPQWRLVLAGDGPQHAELKQLAQHLQIGGSVHFAGWVSDPWSLYRQSNLLAMTSHYEGVPVAMLEAMACGLPCVSTPSASTVVELAQSGALGLAASTGPEDIAAALSLAMADESLRARLAERGKLAVQPYSWSEIGPKWDELLMKVRQD